MHWKNTNNNTDSSRAIIYRGSRSIYRILTLSFIAIAITPLIIISYALWDGAWDNAWREVEEKHKLLAINIASPLSLYIKGHRSTLELVSHQISYINNLSESHEIEELLHDTIAYLDDFQALYFVTPTGKVIYRSGKLQLDNPSAEVILNKNCYQRALNKRRSSISGAIYSPIFNTPTILLCDPVLNQKDKVGGVLVGELNIAPLEKIRSKIQFGILGHSAFVDQFGKVIAHPNPKWMEEIKDLSEWPIVQNMLSGKTGVQEFYSPFLGETMVAGFAGDPITGWGVMVPQPRSEIEDQVYDLMKNHLYWGIAGLSIAFSIAILLARWITLPINQLAFSASALKIAGFKGQISDANANAPREILELTHTIQDLTEGFKESQKENLELNESLESRVEQATKELQLANAHLERVASVDELTELPNRRNLQHELEITHELAFSESKTYSLLLCDLDRFKLVNDNFGHHIGDEVLKIFSKKAPKALREGDVIGRWGGEEFLCILKDSSPNDARITAERIRDTINETICMEENICIDMSVSIGISSYPECGSNIGIMLSNADAALYEAKRSGRNRVVSSSGGDQGVFTIAGLIHDALSNNHIHAAYQNIVDLQTEEVVAEEALARIVNDDGQLEAHQFIEAASQLQLIHRIDHKIINHTINRMNQQKINNERLLQFVNVSTDLLKNPELVNELVIRLENWKKLHNNQDVPIVIEITEREFLGETDEAVRLLKPFLDKNYLLAIDDFGSGYSSFQYLTDLPISYLKIEGNLVCRAVKEPKVRSVLMAIQDTAKELNVITLAECIENKETYELLRSIGIQLGQGRFFGSPMIDESTINSFLTNVVPIQKSRYL